jgi:hypothetical protein
MKDGSCRPTKIKYCDGCCGFHSAKNFKREQEKHLLVTHENNNGSAAFGSLQTYALTGVCAEEEEDSNVSAWCDELTSSTQDGASSSTALSPEASPSDSFNSLLDACLPCDLMPYESQLRSAESPTYSHENGMEPSRPLNSHHQLSSSGIDFQALPSISETRSGQTSRLESCNDDEIGRSEQNKVISLQQRAMRSSARYGNYHAITLDLLVQLAHEYCIVGIYDKAINIYNKV